MDCRSPVLESRAQGSHIHSFKCISPEKHHAPSLGPSEKLRVLQLSSMCYIKLGKGIIYLSLTYRYIDHL